MDLLHGHFYTTIEEAKIAIKQYLNYIILFVWIALRRIKKMLFVGIAPWWIKKISYSSVIVPPNELKQFYSSGNRPPPPDE